LAGDRPVEEHADRRELLLDRGRLHRSLQLLDIAGDVMRPDRREREAAVLTPVEKPVARPQIRPPGVRVADIRREEFDMASGSFVAKIGDERGHDVHPARGSAVTSACWIVAGSCVLVGSKIEQQ
jgi:hypothetical protein